MSFVHESSSHWLADHTKSPCSGAVGTHADGYQIFRLFGCTVSRAGITLAFVRTRFSTRLDLRVLAALVLSSQKVD